MECHEENRKKYSYMHSKEGMVCAFMIVSFAFMIQVFYVCMYIHATEPLPVGIVTKLCMDDVKPVHLIQLSNINNIRNTNKSNYI